MTQIRKIWTSKFTNDINEYVGRDGEIFYASGEVELRFSDGVTPGGLPFTPGGGGSGTTGPTGSPGASGYSGYSGAIGLQGYSGAKGNDGLSGTSGYSGAKGNDGLSGTSGYSGSVGATGETGPIGLIGPIGSTGPTGQIGDTGPQGPGGLSGGLTLYLDSSGGASPVTGTLIAIPNIGPETTVTTSLNSTSGTLIGTWTTIIGVPGVTSVAGGNWNVWVYASRSGAANVRFWSVIDEVASDGTTSLQTLLNGSYATGTTINTSTSSIYDFSAYVPATPLASNASRIRVRLYAQAVSANPTLTTYYRDGTISYLITTISANLLGPTGPTGQSITGESGFSGYSGQDGSDGASGVSGYSGTGTSGFSGYSGAGASGYSGFSGAAGADGITGASGYSGFSGYSGLLGPTGAFSNVQNDVSTNADRYVLLAGSTGTLATSYISDTKLIFNPSAGILSAVDYNSLSDQKYKTNIQPLDNATAILNQLRPVRFTWAENGKVGYGVIAQEIEQILPQVVENSILGKTVGYLKLIPFLIQSLQEMQMEIANLKKQNDGK